MLFGGITLPGRPDLRNVEKLDRLPVPQVMRMMKVGITIDPVWFDDLTSKLTIRQAELKSLLACQIPPENLDRFVDSSGEELNFNPDSSVQVAALVFDLLGLGKNRDVRLKKTKSGAISTGKKQLETLKNEHEAVRLVLEYRECSKLKNTYTTALPKIAKVHNRGECAVCGLRHRIEHKRVHTQILPTRAATGRFQSKTPNLFNIPARTKLGREVRKGFIPEPDDENPRKLVGNDLSQIEMRILADRAQEKNLIRIFKERRDPHADTAMRAFSKTLEEVTKMTRRPDPESPVWATWDGDSKRWKVKPEFSDAYSDYDSRVSDGISTWFDEDGKLLYRAPCKNVGFGVVYGLQPAGLYDLMAVTYATAGMPLPSFITLEWCDQFIKDWLGLYPEASAYFDLQHWRAKEHGIVWDMFGRVRRIPEVRSCHEDIRAAGLRQAVNMPIQSGNAGILKIAMARIERRFEELRGHGIYVEALLPVYDEVIAETEDAWSDEVNEIMGQELCGALVDEDSGELRFRVPVLSDGKAMDRWIKD